ncbi:MAG TPA: hypothetical protein VJS11_10940 [Acidobacteriaceae bacterium]|nr:hypothetical protein [Acidobacteriaceae bacterium]
MLIVTMIEDIEAKAAEITGHLGVAIDIAAGRAAALRLLERKPYSVVVLDQMLAETDPPGADLLWRHSGLAVPMQLSLSIGGSMRLERDLRMALARRQREQELAHLAASAEVDVEIKNGVTALLLQSQLALQENDIPPQIESRLRTMAGIADRLRADLQKSPAASPERGIPQGNPLK